MSSAHCHQDVADRSIANTQNLKTVTADLQKNYYSQPECLFPLVELIVTHADTGVRQQAAIQAARLLPKYWDKVDQGQKPAVRQHLFDATMKEQSPAVRHAAARVVATVASLDTTDEGNLWPDLLPTLLGFYQSNDVTAREVSSYLIFSLLEANPTILGDKVGAALQTFHPRLKDDSPEVRINTMMSIGAMLLVFEPEEDEQLISSLHALLPDLLNVLKAAIQAGDEEKIGHGFEVFQQFLAYESALLGVFLKDLVLFMVEVAANTELDEDVRSQALSFLAQTVRYRRMKIQGMKDMGELLTQKAMVILTEIDDEEDDDEMGPARSALALLDQLANDLPPRQVIVPLLNVFPKFAQSETTGYRKAGILALGTVVEGAPDFIASQVKSVMPHVISLLNDPDVGVRHTALVGLARLADDIAEELTDFNEAIMTALVKNLEAAMMPIPNAKMTKKNIEIIRSVCGALDSMSEGLDADFMKKYARELIENIGALIGHDDYKVKVAASGAIGAIAESLGAEFTPFFDKIMHALEPYLVIKGSEDDLSLRSGVMDSVGRIANAVGAVTFQPYVLPLMQSSDEALTLDNSRLRESCFILWSALAKVYEKNFAAFLSGVFKGLFQALERNDDEIQIHLTEEDKEIIGTGESVLTISGKKASKSEDTDDDGMDEDDDDSDWDDIGVTPGALEKEVAIEIVGDVITYSCGASEISEYLEKAVELIAPLAENSYEGCRKAAVGTLWRSYARVWQLYEEETGTSWEPGLPSQQRPPNATLLKLGQIVSKATSAIWIEEADR